MNHTTEFAIKNLVKIYDKNRVLDIAQMSFQSGQFLALMGKNGSGKSTLMRLLAQQELFDSGDILYSGQSLLSTAVKLNPQLVFISEDQELPFPVGLKYWIDMYRKLSPTFDEVLFQRLIQQLEVDIEKPFHGLSRGQKMKALFCLQAPKHPAIYLLDEITSVLDASSRWTLMQFLKEEASRGCLVVMSTNIANEMQGFATDVTLLGKGQVIFSSRCNTLKEQFRKVRVAKGEEALLSPTLAARRISFNGDETWTYMFPFANSAPPTGLEGDAREVTISDVQSYFTASEGQV